MNTRYFATAMLLSLVLATTSHAAQTIPGVDIIVKKTPGGKATIHVAPDLPAGNHLPLNDVDFPIPLGSINTTRSNAKGGLSIDSGDPPINVGPGEWVLDSFFDITYSIELEGPGVGGGPIPFTASGTAHVSGPGVTIADRNGDGSLDLADLVLNTLEGPIHQFDVTVDSFELAGTGGILLRESPTLESTAQILRRDLPDGKYQIASFFDVFTELSLDGGATWTPASSSMQFQTVVPEPSAVCLAIVCGMSLLATSRGRRK